MSVANCSPRSRGLLLGALLLGLFVSSRGVEAQESTRGSRVVRVRAESVRGTRRQAAPIVLPPPTNVYQRATRRDRAGGAGPSGRVRATSR